VIHCQKCGISEEADGGPRILPYWADEPDSRWGWLTLCRPCLQGAREERMRQNESGTLDLLAAPTWDEAPQLTNWHRRMLEGG